MSRYVTDTHALIWHLRDSKKLSAQAKAIFDAVDSGMAEMLVPSIVLVEMIYLAEKGRIDIAAVTEAFNLLNSGSDNYAVALLDTDTAWAINDIARSQVPDMPDRIIAATAKHLGLSLVSRDPAIKGLGNITVIW